MVMMTASLIISGMKFVACQKCQQQKLYDVSKFKITPYRYKNRHTKFKERYKNMTNHCHGQTDEF